MSNTIYDPRTIPSTTYTKATRTGDFTFYAWGDSPDTWGTANQTWGNYGFGIANTAYDPRIEITDTPYSVRTPI